MLHVLYIIINISCPRERIKNPGMSCNLLRVPMCSIYRYRSTEIKAYGIFMQNTYYLPGPHMVRFGRTSSLQAFYRHILLILITLKTWYIRAGGGTLLSRQTILYFDTHFVCNFYRSCEL